MTLRRVVFVVVLGIASLIPGFAAATQAHNTHHRVLFRNTVFLPGQTATATITIPTVPVQAQPFLHLDDAIQHCAITQCASPSPSLADAMQLTVRDDAGQKWSGSVSHALHGLALPGGLIDAGHSRTYSVTLGLPATAGNRFQGLSLDVALTWGGTDASGTVVTKPGHGQIGGPQGNRPDGGNTGSTSVSSQGSSLPFTGFDAVRLVITALVLVGAGWVAVIAARRRRQHR